jgi:hypothetical protein
VQEAHDKEELPPLLPANCIQHILVHPLVRRTQPSLHANGGLIGDFDTHLEKANRELRVGLSCDPQSEKKEEEACCQLMRPLAIFYQGHSSGHMA